MADKYEQFVRWYLRFNGYLAIENFVIHRPDGSGVPQGGEIDILSVRFPFSREDVTSQDFDPTRIQKDSRLLSDPRFGGRVDFILAEVKSKNAAVNDIWRVTDTTNEKAAKVAYILRWLGAFKNESTIMQVSEDLQQHHVAFHGRYCFRVLCFAKTKSQQAVPPSIQQITFQEIAEFIVKVRTQCWIQAGLGVHSQHPQWDEMILRIWKLGDPKRAGSSEEKIRNIAEYLESFSVSTEKSSRR